MIDTNDKDYYTDTDIVLFSNKKNKINIIIYLLKFGFSFIRYVNRKKC